MYDLVRRMFSRVQADGQRLFVYCERGWPAAGCDIVEGGEKVQKTEVEVYDFGMI